MHRATISVRDRLGFSGRETNANDWLTPGRFSVLLCLLIVGSFPRIVFGLNTFAYLDFGQFAYPVAFYHRETFWHGDLPFWNPLSSCGMPFLAQWNTLTLYPPSLCYLLLPFPWSLGIFCLLHLYFAGIGMYLLAQRWTGHRLAAGVAGAVFAFNGMTWYGLMWPHLIAALAWMPWVVLTMEQAWRKGGRGLVTAAMAGALQMLSGGAEVILQTWLFIGALWLVRFLRQEISRKDLAGRALASGCLATGLAAVQLLPFFDLLAHSQRTTHYADPNLAAMPLTGWANYLVPIFRCFRNPQGLFVPADHWTASYYLGVGVVMLALLAVWRKHNYLVWLLAALSGFSLVMALGERGLLYGALTRLVPMLGFVRFPIKFVMLATFAIPLLAALGLAWLLALPGENWAWERRNAAILTISLLAVMAAIVWAAWKYPLPNGDLAATIRNALGRALFLVLFLNCILWLRRESNRMRQILLQLGVILLLWSDVLTHNSNLSPTVQRQVFASDAVRRLFGWDQRLAAGGSRAMQDQASLRQMLTAGFTKLELDTKVRRLSQFFDYNLLDHVPKFDGFYSLELNEFSELFQLAYARTNEVPAKLQDFLGISLICTPTNIVSWVSRPNFLPLVTAGQRPVFADAASTKAALFGSGFEPERTVYLPLEARGEVRANATAMTKAALLQFSPHWLAIDVEADAPAMVVIAQAFYHPWHAYLDGKAVPLWRANHAFQALEVPPGTHQVTLVYEDKAFLWGAVLTLASLLVCGWLWLAGRGRRGAGGLSK